MKLRRPRLKAPIGVRQEPSSAASRARSAVTAMEVGAWSSGATAFRAVDRRRCGFRCRWRPVPGPAGTARGRATAVASDARPSRLSPATASSVASATPSAQLFEPGVDIAAERHDVEVRPVPQHLRGAADRRGAEAGAARQVVEAPGSSATRRRRAHPRVRGRPRAPGHRAGGRHVLARMDAEIDLAAEQRRPRFPW